MFERIIIIIIGSVIIYLLRFKLLRKPLSPMRSILVATIIMVAGIQFHYAYLPYETFRGGVTYTSLGFIAFLLLQYGYRKTAPSKKESEEK